VVYTTSGVQAAAQCFSRQKPRSTSQKLCQAVLARGDARPSTLDGVLWMTGKNNAGRWLLTVGRRDAHWLITRGMQWTRCTSPSTAFKQLEHEKGDEIVFFDKLLRMGSPLGPREAHTTRPTGLDH